MKAKDLRTANAIRMVNTKVMERRTGAGFKGQVNDDLYRDVIGAYKKSLEKARQEYKNAGERGAEQVVELEWEIEFLSQFLPSMLGADETRAAVREVIAEAGGVADPKMAGRLVGAVMKKHKGRVDAALVKQLIEQELAAGG